MGLLLVVGVLTGGRVAAVVTTAGRVSSPKLPSQVPNTFINSIPNQFETLSWLSIKLSRLTLEVALPEVALPADVLLVTVALPLEALSLILLFIV
jgi:hypothetical protein